MAERPNVLLIVFDTARADAFSPYATGRDTPAVAQLASRGVAYPKAFAPSCWTVPSHAAMLLGAPPRSVGLSRTPGGEGSLCAPVIEQQAGRFLPEVFRAAGYSTAGVSANLWISERTGFARGFDTFHEVTGDRVSKMAQPGLRTRARWYLDALRARADDGALVIESKLDEWLNAASRAPGSAPGRAPFFWFVNIIECHSPYLPPRPFNDLGPLGRVAAAEDVRRYQTLEAVLRAAATGNPPPKKSLDRMLHMYERSIVLMDRWLARILDAFDRRNLLDSTTVVVTSDHGENFGENGLIGHAGSLDDRLLSVPLIAAGPGVPDEPEPVVAMSDLPRMLADFTGLDDHPWGQRPTPGVAVAQYDGPVRADDPRAQLLHEWGASPEGITRLTERFTCATDGALKLVHAGGTQRLFDLTEDPLETAGVDPSGSADERVAPLRRAIDLALEEAWDPDVSKAESPPDEDVSDIEERMRLLGYL